MSERDRWAEERRGAARRGDDAWAGPPWAPPWRRRRGYPHGRRRGPWGGFGCIAGILFLVVASSVLFVVGSLLASLGPIPAVIAVAAAIVLLVAIGRALRGASRSLDDIVDAAGRVEAGDYRVRVGQPRSDLPPIRSLAASFDTMVERLAVDDEQRRTLLADLSHELRTPLSVITGNLEAMVDGVYPADEAHLAPILDEARVLERLIDDLRTIALSDAGTLALHPEPIDPDLLIEEVVGSFRAAADAVGVSLHADPAGHLPIVDVDPVRMREVLANLVANALRHTPAGGSVVLGGTVATGSGSGDTLVLTVTDTGPGIDPALLPHVFDRFVTGDTSRGSGLGLAIAKGLVEAHGGTIVAESPVVRSTGGRETPPDAEASGGVGTRFRVEIPISDSGRG